MPKAVHIKMKVIIWAFEIGSLYKKTPKRNIQLGAIYCRNPRVDRVNRLAPRVKRRSGMAVRNAAPIRKKSILTLMRNRAPVPLLSRNKIYAHAGTERTSISTERPTRELTVAIFRISP